MNKTIYRQADSRWGNLPYPTKAYKFASNGCGCCSVTHCAIELDKYKNYTPKDVRPYMVQFATCGHGTEWKGITAGLGHYGYNVANPNIDKSMTPAWNVLKNSLKRGVLLFGSSRGGTQKILWTTGGHYIAFTDWKYENGDYWFYLKDSGGRKRDGWWAYKRHMAGDVRQIWICTSLKATPTPSKPKKGTYTGTIPTPTIRKGTKGDKARNLQKFLNWYGGYGLAVDGIFGTKSVEALKKFQKAEGSKTCDGIYGTWTQGKAKAYKKQVSP